MNEIKIINTNNFRHNMITINFVFEVDDKMIFLYSILEYCLDVLSKKYNTRTKRRNIRFKLFDSQISFSSNVSYKTYILRFSSIYLKEKYTKKDITKEVIDCMYEYLLNPLCKNNKFDENLVNEAKDFLIDDIKSLYEDIDYYVTDRIYQKMYGDDILGICSIDYIDYIKSITPIDVYLAYTNLLNSSRNYIAICGEYQDEKKLKSYFNRFNLQSKEIKYESDYTIKSISNDIKIYSEKYKTKQTICKLGYFININRFDDLYYAYELFNLMFCFGYTSTVYKRLRVENQLCYHVFSKKNIEEKSMFITFNIDYQNINKTIEIVKEEHENYKKGLIDLKLFEKCKNEYIDSIEDCKENLETFINLYTGNLFYGKTNTFESVIEDIKNIKINDIVEVAKMLKLDTIYYIYGDDDENSNI